MVHDITDKASFINLKQWAEEFKNKGPENCILCIASNKEDLSSEEAINEEDIQKFAKEIDAFVFKTSAKLNSGIDKMF